MAAKTETTNLERQVYGIRVLKPSHPALRKLKSTKTPTLQGFKYWSATWLLLDYLTSRQIPLGARVLDVGCGWGFAGIYCAVKHQAHVTAVDIDPRVFPYLQIHADLNEVEIKTIQAAFDEIAPEVFEGVTWLIGADICFKEPMIETLKDLLERALTAGIGHIAITDPGRPAFERLASTCCDQLGATCIDLVCDEPLIDWPGAILPLRGRLLELTPVKKKRGAHKAPRYNRHLPARISSQAQHLGLGAPFDLGLLRIPLAALHQGSCTLLRGYSCNGQIHPPLLPGRQTRTPWNYRTT